MLELEILVRGAFDKSRFLELMVTGFLLSEDDTHSDSVHKILAGYHQFHAVPALCLVNSNWGNNILGSPPVIE